MKKTILVTGGAGFIGRQTLQPLVDSGFSVHVADLRSLEKEYPEVVWHIGNVFDLNSVTKLFAEIKPTHLLNFAWITRHGEYWSSVENIDSVNGSMKMLEAFAANGGQRVVMAGTCAEYDWQNGICIENITRHAPATIYGSCKLAMFELLKSFCRIKGLSWAWGRIFFTFGPFENPKRFLPAIILPLLKKQPAACSHGNQIRDFLATREIGSAFAALVSSNTEGPVNIASGQPLTLRQIANFIEELTETKGLLELGKLSSPADEAPVIIAATERLNKEVGWVPEKTVFQRITETVDWWRQND